MTTKSQQKCFLFALACVSSFAVSPAAYAQTILDTALTSTQNTSSGTGGLSLVAPGSINVSGSEAVQMDASSAPDNIFTIGAGTTVTSNNSASYGGTIRAIDNSTPTLEVNGTLINTHSTPTAVDWSNLGSSYGGTIRQNAGAQITGAITLGLGNNTYERNGGVAYGSINLNDGEDRFSVTGGTSLSSVDGGADTDTIQVRGTFLNINSSFSNFERLELRAPLAGEATTDVTLASDHGTGTYNSIETRSGSRLNIRRNIVVNDFQAYGGDLSFVPGSSLTVNSLAIWNPGAITGTFQLNDGQVTQLAFSAPVNMTGFNITVTPGDYLSTGSTFDIIDNVGLTTGGTLLPSDTALYSFAMSDTDGGNDRRITVTRNDMTTVASSNNSQLSSIFETLENNGDDDIDTIQGQLGSLGTVDELNDALDSLKGTNPSEIMINTIDTQQKIVTDVMARLASLDTGGIAAGDHAADRMWIQAFAQDAKHDGDGNNSGFDSTTGGLTVGFDKDIAKGEIGVALSYGVSGVESAAANRADTDIKTLNLSLYGTRKINQQNNVNWLAAIAHNDITTQRTINVGGFDRSAEGETNGLQFTAKGELVHNLPKDGNLLLTPLLGAQLTTSHVNEYTETGAGGANLNIDTDNLLMFEVSAGARATWEYNLASGTVFTPSLLAKVNYNLGDTSVDTTSSFAGSGSSFTTDGIEMSRFGATLGGGLSWENQNGLEVSVNYDAQLRDNYVAHNGFVKIRWPF